MDYAGDILIADDTAANISVLRNILTGNGYRARPALNGKLALKAALANPPDVILLDIMMPEMDGYETCRRLKENERTRQIPVIFISALSETDDKIKGFEAGGVDFVQKPFQAEEVLARVKTHLSLRQTQRKLEEQNADLVNAAKLREDVERILRHDLKGPLGNIIGFSQLIEENKEANTESVELARIIREAGYSMLRMVNASFDLMKMERKKYRFDPVSVDIVESIRRVIAETSFMASRRNIGFSLTSAGIELARDIEIFVRGDTLLCHSLLSNLVKNATEAAPRGSRIAIAFEDTGSTVAVAIKNAGEVPENIRARFFEKYSSSGKDGGTGLGTYSARLMARTQDGDISLDTSEPGHTTVTVILPKASPDILEPEPARRMSTAGPPDDSIENIDWEKLAPAGVLVADDDEANRIFIERALPSPPLHVSHAANGEEALHVLRHSDISIAFLDIEMPVLGGVDAVREWRRFEQEEGLEKTVTCVAISAHDEPEIRETCFKAGFDLFLSKPVGRKELRAEIGQILALTGDSSHEAGENGGAATEAGRATLPTADDHRVEVDEDLEDIIPSFLEERRSIITTVIEALAREDFATVRKLAHQLKGSFGMYGFHHASECFGTIETAAVAHDAGRIAETLNKVDDHLRRLSITYVNTDLI